MSQSTAFKLRDLLDQFERDIHQEVQRHGPSPFGPWGPMAPLSIEGYRKVIISRVRASYKMLTHMRGLQRGYYVFRDFLQSNQTLKQIDQIFEEHYRGRT